MARAGLGASRTCLFANDFDPKKSVSAITLQSSWYGRTGSPPRNRRRNPPPRSAAADPRGGCNALCQLTVFHETTCLVFSAV